MYIHYRTSTFQTPCCVVTNAIYIMCVNYQNWVEFIQTKGSRELGQGIRIHSQSVEEDDSCIRGMLKARAPNVSATPTTIEALPHYHLIQGAQDTWHSQSPRALLQYIPNTLDSYYCSSAIPTFSIISGGIYHNIVQVDCLICFIKFQNDIRAMHDGLMASDIQQLCGRGTLLTSMWFRNCEKMISQTNRLSCRKFLKGGGGAGFFSRYQRIQQEKSRTWRLARFGVMQFVKQNSIVTNFS